MLRELSLRQSADTGFFVQNLMVVQCDSLEDLVAVAAEAHRNRHVASHELNQVCPL